jgi:hypothetical protein
MGWVMSMDEKNETAGRREFVKTAALGAIGSLMLPGCLPARESATPRVITVFGIVDIAQALADDTLTGNLYFLDNNKDLGSQFLGTDHLRTALRPGDLIQWLVYGLQVETVADIVSIAGPAAVIANPTSIAVAPGIAIWVGKIAPTANGIYQYSVVLSVEHRTMGLSSPLSLEVL